MKEKITKYLREIEIEKSITILLACETGSRAWGFPSPDSDYDVRIIYKHNKDWYLSLNERKDSIEKMFDDNEIDITGWDIRKALRLLRKSNASLLERIQSPIIYQKDDVFLAGMIDVANAQYSRIATIHHYLSMAKKFVEELKSGETYRLKKFFYALRAATVCKWIVEKEEIPPIEFMKTVQGLDLPVVLLERIETLIALKATKSEQYFHEGETMIFEYIENCIALAEDMRISLPSSKGKMEDLNAFFIQTIA